MSSTKRIQITTSEFKAFTDPSPSPAPPPTTSVSVATTDPGVGQTKQMCDSDNSHGRAAKTSPKNSASDSEVQASNATSYPIVRTRNETPTKEPSTTKSPSSTISDLAAPNTSNVPTHPKSNFEAGFRKQSPREGVGSANLPYHDKQIGWPMMNQQRREPTNGSHGAADSKVGQKRQTSDSDNPYGRVTNEEGQGSLNPTYQQGDDKKSTSFAKHRLRFEQDSKDPHSASDSTAPTNQTFLSNPTLDFVAPTNSTSDVMGTQTNASQALTPAANNSTSDSGVGTNPKVLSNATFYQQPLTEYLRQSTKSDSAAATISNVPKSTIVPTQLKSGFEAGVHMQSSREGVGLTNPRHRDEEIRRPMMNRQRRETTDGEDQRAADLMGICRGVSDLWMNEEETLEDLPDGEAPITVSTSDTSSMSFSKSTRERVSEYARQVNLQHREENHGPVNLQGRKKQHPELVKPDIHQQHQRLTHGEGHGTPESCGMIRDVSKRAADDLQESKAATKECHRDDSVDQNTAHCHESRIAQLVPQPLCKNDLGASDAKGPDNPHDHETAPKQDLAMINSQARETTRTGVHAKPSSVVASNSSSSATVASTQGRGKEGIQILVTGTLGVGKSTLVNGLVGKHAAETKHQLLPVTSTNLTGYTVNLKDVTEEEGNGEIEAVVWDTPGLQSNSGREYDSLSEKFADIDIIIYCMDVTVTRSSGLTAADIDQNDLSAIKKLTSIFGSDWWKRSIFVMTRANALVTALRVKPDFEKRFTDKIMEWKEHIVATLVKTGVPKEIASEIPVEPAGYPKKPHLPGRENWLKALWHIIVKSAKNLQQKDQMTSNTSTLQASENSDSSPPSVVPIPAQSQQSSQTVSTVMRDSSVVRDGVATDSTTEYPEASWTAVHFPGLVIHLRVLKVQEDRMIPIYPTRTPKPQSHDSTCEHEEKTDNTKLPGGVGSEATSALTDTSPSAIVGGFSWRAVNYEDDVVFLQIKPNEVPRETEV